MRQVSDIVSSQVGVEIWGFLSSAQPSGISTQQIISYMEMFDVTDFMFWIKSCSGDYAGKLIAISFFHHPGINTEEIILVTQKAFKVSWLINTICQQLVSLA